MSDVKKEFEIFRQWLDAGNYLCAQEIMRLKNENADLVKSRNEMKTEIRDLQQALNETLICGIGWIDNHGEPTFDKNPAIAFAVSHGWVHGENGSTPVAICETHAKMIVEQNLRDWKLQPLIGQSVDEAHELAKRSARDFKILPDVVRDSIRKSFSKDFIRIMNEIYYTMGYWAFTLDGIYYGVESDGYIHT